jgi:hypothetical protein
MNLIQQIAAALSCIALCMIIHFGIENWRSIAAELGYMFEKKVKLNMHAHKEKIDMAVKIMKGEWIDS